MQSSDHKYQGIMKSCIPSLGKNYITLVLKIVKNSCKCYDKSQALRKKQYELLAKLFHPTTCWTSPNYYHICLAVDFLLYTWIKPIMYRGWISSRNLGNAYIKKTWSPDFDWSIHHWSPILYRTRGLFKLLCCEIKYMVKKSLLGSI